MHENDRRRRQLQRPLHDLAHIDGRVIDGALPLNLVGNEVVLLIEEQDAELFAGFEALRETKIVKHPIP